MILALMLRPQVQEQMAPFDHWFYMTDHYQRIFDGLGIALAPIYSAVQLEALASVCDGLIVPGNVHDIPPRYYGQQPLAGLRYDFDDFALDRRAILAFAGQGKPVLGICSGLQAINVAFGGSLHQRIAGHFCMDGAAHSIDVAPGSFAARACGLGEAGGRLAVNTFHNQAADRVADGFTVTARAADGTVEAVERGSLIGVQWHPEACMDTALFRQFAALAGRP